MSNSVRTHGLQPTRLPRPWDSPGKNTGAGCHFLLQCMKVKSESEVAQSCPTLSNPMDCSPPGSSIHGIFQARVLQWGAIAFSSFLPELAIIDFYSLQPKLWLIDYLFHTFSKSYSSSHTQFIESHLFFFSRSFSFYKLLEILLVNFFSACCYC